MHLSTWLTKIASVHVTDIELGLLRVKEVAARLNLLAFTCPVIIVGGTNGKGSTVAGLESIYQAAGYQTGSFTSPFLFSYTEQIRLNSQSVSETELCAAFEKIEKARAEISLTQFEFGTLAALLIFKAHPTLDVIILEVGLGGRLDAVNIIDADVAVVTSIGMDHVDWLGSTREEIAYEKAGIFRSNKAAVCGDTHPPSTLVQHAKKLGALFYSQTQAFHYVENKTHWSWHSAQINYDLLPLTSLATQNMSVVLMVITLLQPRLAVKAKAIEQGLKNVTLLGRIQIIEDAVSNITKIADVAHNPDAIRLLAMRLKTMPHTGKTYAVFSMLADKDILQSLQVIKDQIDYWYVAPLAVKRAASKEKLQDAFNEAHIHAVLFYSSLEKAHEEALHVAQSGDRIIIFGSFHTVAISLKSELSKPHSL